MIHRVFVGDGEEVLWDEGAGSVTGSGGRVLDSLREISRDLPYRLSCPPEMHVTFRNPLGDRGEFVGLVNALSARLAVFPPALAGVEPGGEVEFYGGDVEAAGPDEVE